MDDTYFNLIERVVVVMEQSDIRLSRSKSGGGNRFVMRRLGLSCLLVSRLTAMVI